MQDPDPDLGQDPDGGLLDGLDLVLRQDPGRLEGVDELAVPLRTGGRGSTSWGRVRRLSRADRFRRSIHAATLKYGLPALDGTSREG